MMAALVLATALAQTTPAQDYYTRPEAEAMLAEANQAYARGDASKAAEGYLKLAEHGFGSADVLYDLGTSELSAGQLGPAVLHLEQARRAGGSAPDVEANLALARTRITDHVLGGQGDAGLWRRIANATDRNAAAWALVASIGIGFGLLAVARLLGARGRGLRPAAALVLLTALPSAAIVGAHWQAETNDTPAVVLADTLPVRALPDESARVLFEVHPGLEVRVMDRQNGLIRIRLPNEAEGWVDGSGLAPITDGQLARGPG